MNNYNYKTMMNYNSDGTVKLRLYLVDIETGKETIQPILKDKQTSQLFKNEGAARRRANKWLHKEV